MAIELTFSHRIHINLNLNGLIIRILLEQPYLLRDDFLYLLRIVFPLEFHHHLLDIQVFHS